MTSARGSGYPSGAFLWSGMTVEGDYPLWKRAVLLPFYLAIHSYHCLRGTPVYVQYGNHDLRQEAQTESDD